MAKIVQDASLTSVADAIRAKTGGTEQLTFPGGFVSAIEGIGGGGGDTNPVAQSKAVDFIDYDGTIRYSYTVEEAAALTELPPLPVHDGLVCQGWNWSLADIKALGRAVTVGAMYITDDGKTRIYIHLEEGRTSPMLGCCPNGTVTVDWGDGTTPDTLTGTSTSTVKWTPTHEYAAPGDYVIKLTVSGSMGLYGSDSLNSYSALLRYSSGAYARNRVYQAAVRKVEIGGVTSIGKYALSSCISLSAVTIPNGTFINYNAFGNCYSLSAVVIPSGVKMVGIVGGLVSAYAFYACYSLSAVATPSDVLDYGVNAFRNCYSLSTVALPNGLTGIRDNTFFACNSLSAITIPNSVTSIGTYAFGDCYGVRYYDFTAATSVPTLSNVNALSNIADDCEIRVPAALADEWKAATNWATYADHIVGV